MDIAAHPASTATAVDSTVVDSAVGVAAFTAVGVAVASMAVVVAEDFTAVVVDTAAVADIANPVTL
jgi:hypothetical protein